MITSVKNTKIKEIKALQSRKKNRTESGSFVVEGVRILEEVLESGLIPTLTLHTEELSERGMELVRKAVDLNTLVEIAMPHVMSAASDTDNSQGILMIFPFPEFSHPKNATSVLILDNIRDPGNMGTLLRSAAAADFDTVWLSPGCVDPFSPKVVRSGMGANFKIPIFNLSYEEISSHLSNNQLHLFISEMDADINYTDANLIQASAIVVGSEAVGTSDELLAISHKKIKIPMPGKVESLNASVAGSLIIFELVRQRIGKQN